MIAGIRAGLLAGVTAISIGLAPAAEAQGQGLRVRPVTLMHSDMEAIRGLVPEGWQARGGLFWGERCISYGYNIDWGAFTPDGSHGMAFLPGLGWGLNPITGCTQQPLASLDEAILFQARRLWPDARLIDTRRRPDVTGGAQMPMLLPDLSLQGLGVSMVTWLDAGEALFAFTGPGGQEMRGAILLSGLFTTSEIRYDDPGLQLDPSLFAGTGIPMPAVPENQTFLGGGTDWGFAVWAPAGQLDFTAAEALRKSFVPLPGWFEFISKHRAVIDRQNAESAAKIAKINSDTNREISAIIAQGYDARMASQDRQQREFVESIRGVETWVDTSGNPVQLDYNYNHAWQLNDGSFFLTNDPSYDPTISLGVGGQRLQVAP